MKRLSLIRLAILIFMRDLLIPGGGLFLSIYLPIKGILSPWHLPLIAGMLGTPLVARGGEADPPDDPPPQQPPVLPPGREALSQPNEEEPT